MNVFHAQKDLFYTLHTQIYPNCLQKSEQRHKSCWSGVVRELRCDFCMPRNKNVGKYANKTNSLPSLVRKLCSTSVFRLVRYHG